MTWLFMIAAVAYYVGIGWAVVFHFRSKTRPVAFTVLTIVTALNLCICLYFLSGAASDLLRISIAFGLVLVAGGLFVWTLAVSRNMKLKLIYDAAEPHQLLEAGPFRFIRHPFYVSYSIFWIGCAVATFHPINICFALVIVPTFAYAAWREECSFEATPLRDAYASYRQRTGFFWPRW